MTSLYTSRIKSSLPLFLGGTFMIYLAIVDDTIFNYILEYAGQNRTTITIATIVSTAPLMFFAIGFIKQSILHEWQVIYQYERLLEHVIFWIMAIILMLVIVTINVVGESIHILNIHVFGGCVGFSVYLMIRAAKKNKTL